jgi:hypothetical protein
VKPRLTRTGIHELHIPGWADLLFSDEYVSDGTVAMVRRLELSYQHSVVS